MHSTFQIQSALFGNWIHCVHSHRRFEKVKRENRSVRWLKELSLHILTQSKKSERKTIRCSSSGWIELPNFIPLFVCDPAPQPHASVFAVSEVSPSLKQLASNNATWFRLLCVFYLKQLLMPREEQFTRTFFFKGRIAQLYKCAQIYHNYFILRGGLQTHETYLISLIFDKTLKNLFSLEKSSCI